MTISPPECGAIPITKKGAVNCLATNTDHIIKYHSKQVGVDVIILTNINTNLRNMGLNWGWVPWHKLANLDFVTPGY